MQNNGYVLLFAIQSESDQLLMMDLLWDIAIDETPTGPPTEICQSAVVCLQDAVRQYTFKPNRYSSLSKLYPESICRHKWMMKMIDCASQFKSVSFCYEILGTIIGKDSS